MTFDIPDRTKEQIRKVYVKQALEIIKAEAQGGSPLPIRMRDLNIVKIYADWIEKALESCKTKEKNAVNAALEIIKAEARGGNSVLRAYVRDRDNLVKIYAEWIEDALKVPDA